MKFSLLIRAGLTLGLASLLAPVSLLSAPPVIHKPRVKQAPTGTDRPSAAVQAIIDSQEAAFLKAVLAKDQTALKNLLAEDFVYVHENTLISTRAQFLEDFIPAGYVAAVRTSSEPDRQYGSTVFTISTGHLQFILETPYPPMTVSHVWAEMGGKWRLVHRHEAHAHEPIGKQLSQRGGPNLTEALGSKPSPEIAKIINERQASWVYSMVTTDVARMEEMHDASLRYVHVNGRISGKIDFIEELKGGYSETHFSEATMRQFGDTVLVLARAQYRHTGWAEQSASIVYHAWFKRGDRWVMVGRHGARFENY